MSGADTITSLLAIPRAQARIAPAAQAPLPGPRSSDADRMKQYSVNR